MGEHPGSLPFVKVPPAAVTRILSRFDRDQLASFVTIAIDLLDLAGDDPDAPDFSPRSDGAPGDPIDAEPGGDDRDHSWPEWDNRGRHKLAAGGYEMSGVSAVNGASEDDEDDDPAEADGDEADGSGAEDEGCAWFASMHLGPGCAVTDQGIADSDALCEA